MAAIGSSKVALVLECDEECSRSTNTMSSHNLARPDIVFKQQSYSHMMSFSFQWSGLISLIILTRLLQTINDWFATKPKCFRSSVD